VAEPPRPVPPADPVVVEVEVRASAAAVFAAFTDPAGLASWIGVRAVLEPVPGGAFALDLPNGARALGRYVEVVPHKRVVFTWGWDDPRVPVAPGSTTVTVELAEREGRTRVRLTHAGLDAVMAPWHAEGWGRYLARLAAVCEGRDPGPDPATEGGEPPR
jgi:uncharacterized protein YndB with AHSA1/START domain